MTEEWKKAQRQRQSLRHSARVACQTPSQLLSFAGKALATRAYRRMQWDVDVSWEDDPLSFYEPRWADVPGFSNLLRGGQCFRTMAQSREAEMLALSERCARLSLKPEHNVAAEPGAMAVLLASDPRDKLHGYARRTLGLLGALADRGAALHAVVPSAALGTEIVRPGLLIHGLGLEPYQDQRLTDHIDVAIEKVCSIIRTTSITTVMASSNWLPGFIGLSAAREIACPFVYEMRGLWHETRASVEPGFIQSTGYQWQEKMEQALASSADVTFVLSEAMAHRVRTMNGEKPPVIVLPNGTADQPPPLANERLQHSICYVGTFTPYEGLDTLLGALPALINVFPGLLVSLYGDGPEKGRLQALAGQFGLDSTVTFPGTLAPDAVLSTYAQHSLAVFPRERTRVTALVPPLKPAEAMRAGTPIIVTDLAPLKEYVGDRDERGLTVPAGNAPLLARAIANVFNDPVAAAQRATEAQLFIGATRLWPTIAETVLETLRDVLGADLIIRP